MARIYLHTYCSAHNQNNYCRIFLEWYPYNWYRIALPKIIVLYKCKQMSSLTCEVINLLARIHKGGLSTNRGLCTSYDAFWLVFLQTWFVNNKRRFVETKGGLSTNLLCEFGPSCPVWILRVISSSFIEHRFCSLFVVSVTRPYLCTHLKEIHLSQVIHWRSWH